MPSVFSQPLLCDLGEAGRQHSHLSRCSRKNVEEEENKKFALLLCVGPGLAGVASALAQHAPVREWRRRNRAERHVDRRARKSVER